MAAGRWWTPPKRAGAPPRSAGGQRSRVQQATRCGWETGTAVPKQSQIKRRGNTARRTSEIPPYPFRSGREARSSSGRTAEGTQMRSWAHCSDYTGYYSGGGKSKRRQATPRFFHHVRLIFPRRSGILQSDRSARRSGITSMGAFYVPTVRSAVRSALCRRP